MKTISTYKYRRPIMWVLAAFLAISSEVFLIVTLKERFGTGFYFSSLNIDPKTLDIDLDKIGSLIIWIIELILKNVV